MAFPPLKDPLEGSDGPEDRDGKRDAADHRNSGNAGNAGNPASRGEGGEQPDRGTADQPRAGEERPEGEAGAADDGVAGHQAPAGDDEDELEELSEQVDLSELEFDDLVEHRAHNAPIPAEPGSVAAAAGADIPMLTEVVQVPRYDTEDLPQTLADVDWGDLGQRVRENVLERLLRRSDALLDAQLQNTLTPVLERAAETVAHELHDALNRMIRDIVARAVTEELTRLHAEIAKRNRSSRPS